MTKLRIVTPHRPHDALTLEQHRRLNLRRPLTHSPIGGNTGGKRAMDAFISAAFSTTPSTKRQGSEG